MCGLRIVFLNLRLYFSAICFATACLCLIVRPIGVSSLPVFQERVTVASPPVSSTFLS